MVRADNVEWCLVVRGVDFYIGFCVNRCNIVRFVSFGTNESGVDNERLRLYVYSLSQKYSVLGGEAGA